MIRRLCADIEASAGALKRGTYLKVQRDFWNHKKHVQEQWLSAWVECRTALRKSFAEIESCWKSFDFSWRLG